MKPKDQKLAIAQAVGYSWMTKHGSYTTHHFGRYTHKDIMELKYNGFIEGRNGVAADCDVYGLNHIPDYPGDLNAMHEAEEILTEEQMHTYGALLAKLRLPLGIPSPAGLSWYGIANIARATADQRAECFLRCLNLWTETPA